MLERILSPRAFKVYMVVAVAMLGVVLWQRFAGGGIIARIDQFQAERIFAGYYYAELSVLILFFPILIIGLAVGFLHDYVTQTGIFAGREDSSDLGVIGSNSSIEYQLAARTDVIAQVRSKYQADIQQLKSLGFDELGIYREIVPRLGAPMGMMGLLGSLGVLANEITRIGPDLTVNVFQIVMASRENCAYASVFGGGVRFQTLFTDQTNLITTNYMGIEYEDGPRQMHRRPSPGPLPSTWDQHRKWVNEFRAAGKAPAENVGIQAYFTALLHEDDFMLKNRSKVQNSAVGKPSFFSETLSTIVSTIVSMGILVGCVAVLTFTGNVVGLFYPTCWFVRNLRSIPVPLNFLAIVASLGISWILARFQHNMFTFNGMGTRMYGREPAADPQSYVSTKWLALPGVPLIPVRSYLITLEGRDILKQDVYRLQPLNRIHWAQVGDTARSSVVRFAVPALILAAFTVWSVSECR